MEPKKSERVDLEHRRGEMFLVALVLILSLAVAALEWDTSVSDEDYDVKLDDLIEDIDFDMLRRNQDMVAALSEADNIEDATNIRSVEALVVQPAEMAAGKLLVGESNTENEEVEEARPPMIETGSDRRDNFHVIEQLPEFPGGAGAFMKWITANLKYPRKARDGKIEGRVVVSFIVDTEGNATALKLEKSSNDQLGQAVLNVMKRMPKWKPAKEAGKPCSAMVAVPINFEL